MIKNKLLFENNFNFKGETIVVAGFQSRVMQLKYSTQPHERCGRLAQSAGKLEQKEGTVQGS